MAGQWTSVAIILENDQLDLADRDDKNCTICFKMKSIYKQKSCSHVVQTLFAEKLIYWNNW